MPTMTATLRPIEDVAHEAGLETSELLLYGPHKAKVPLEALWRRQGQPNARVILVTSINPTPAGEGKTVTSIALAQALRSLGERCIVCLREPSMGPVFGLKGGATGGGRCTVEPADDINLHFTGDIHAVTAANNLLAALADDHLYRGREPLLDVRRMAFHRVLDVNDRALRSVIVGLGGVPREEHMDIAAASEVMAVLGLAGDYADLRRRLERIIVGATRAGTPVSAEDLRAGGAMAALLRDALQPNLVQTQEGGPAFVHAGPFANIAHGTSSLVSLLLARKLADVVVIEAGFGADLGAEKFVDIVGAHGGPRPDVAIIVVTARALKYHGGVEVEHLTEPDARAVTAGLPQLWHHLEIVRRLRMRAVVCLNAFATDSASELRLIRDAVSAWEIPIGMSDGYEAGGAGAREVAEIVRRLAALPAASAVGPLYLPEARLDDKLQVIAKEVYGASGVVYTETAQRNLKEIEAWGFGGLPVCVAKTQYSLTDQPDIRAVPRDFAIHVRDVAVRAGAGFVLALAGDMMTMPALPARPRAWNIELQDTGQIVGLHG